MKYPARPLTEEERQRATTLLAAGMTRTSAAKYAGCRRTDLDSELKHNPAFKAQVEQSELRPEMEYMRTVLAAARDPKQWRAAAWALERMYPQRYGASRRDGVPRKALQKVVAEHVKEQQGNAVRKHGAAKAKRVGRKKKSGTRAKARSTRRDATKKSSAKKQ